MLAQKGHLCECVGDELGPIEILGKNAVSETTSERPGEWI